MAVTESEPNIELQKDSDGLWRLATQRPAGKTVIYALLQSTPDLTGRDARSLMGVWLGVECDGKGGMAITGASVDAVMEWGQGEESRTATARLEIIPDEPCKQTEHLSFAAHRSERALTAAIGAFAAETYDMLQRPGSATVGGASDSYMAVSGTPTDIADMIAKVRLPIPGQLFDTIGLQLLPVEQSDVEQPVAAESIPA